MCGRNQIASTRWNFFRLGDWQQKVWSLSTLCQITSKINFQQSFYFPTVTVSRPLHRLNLKISLELANLFNNCWIVCNRTILVYWNTWMFAVFALLLVFFDIISQHVLKLNILTTRFTLYVQWPQHMFSKLIRFLLILSPQTVLQKSLQKTDWNHPLSAQTWIYFFQQDCYKEYLKIFYNVFFGVF